MQRAAFCVIVLVGLVAVAGCNAFSGSDPATPPVTPAPVPTDDPTSSPVPRLAPGVTKYGLVNASALRHAHKERLENTSFTVHSAWILRYPNGTVAARSVETTRVGDNGNRTYSTWTVTGFPRPLKHGEAWHNAEWGIVKAVSKNNSTNYYRYQIRPQSDPARTSGIIWDFADLFDPQETTVTTLTQNGTTLYRLNGTSRQPNVTIHILVDSHGLIHSYTMRTPSYDTRFSNATWSIRTTQFTTIGTTTVERPSWYAEAINNTTPLNRTTPGA